MHDIDSKMEFVKWLLVQTDSVERAREFFGCAADWPAELDPEGTMAARARGHRDAKVFRVLSSAWLAQQSRKHGKGVTRG